MINKIIIILPLLVSGCAGTQLPAPVTGGNYYHNSKTPFLSTPSFTEAPKEQQEAIKIESPVTSVITVPFITQPPLQLEISEIPVNPLTHEIKPLDVTKDPPLEPLKPIDATGLPPIENVSEPPLKETDQPLKTEEAPKIIESTSEAPKETPKESSGAFKPWDTEGKMTPAVSALVLEANQKINSGDLGLASAALERAIGIEPRNASLLYKLANLRLSQSNFEVSEDIAKKSALLASTDRKLKKQCWLLIAFIRETKKDMVGAKEALSKSDSL